jgi:uncharacterized protein
MEALVEFRNRRRNLLRGMIHRPPRARRPVPGVVFFHGFTGDRMESHWIFIKCARALARRSIASLRFDFYGSGESEGGFREMTLSGEISDALDAVKFFRGRKGIDSRRLGLAGLSMGGAVAACVAQRVRARALALWSAVADTQILLDLAKALARPLPGLKGGLEYDAREISPQFLKDVVKVKPAQALAGFTRPTLIVHGGRDESVPSSHAQMFFKASPAAVKEKVIIPGADHTYTSIAWEQAVIGLTVDWFVRYLIPAATPLRRG